jgi:hypothetical protein
MSATMADAARSAQRRAFWLKQLHQWHWISAALCLIGMLLFAATGITLNHASQIKSKPQVTQHNGEMPAALLAELNAPTAKAGGTLPADVQQWFASQWSLRGTDGAPEWSDDEVYLSMPRPGGDAWLSVDLQSGAATYERTDRGWISFLNDLHKGRNAGLMWSWFIDVFAVACLIFSITGLFLLQLHASRRPSTWSLTGLGLLIPLLLALLFIH